MADFVLVHGAWHGGWCWREVVPRLESRGHRAPAIDLPGHGEDRTWADDVTLRDYVQTIVSAVESLGGPVILVGHSMGAVVSAEAAEEVPDSIQSLVAVASPQALDGLTMMEAVAATDPEYLARLVWAPDRRTAAIQSQGVRDFLYQRCLPQVVELAISRFTPEPVAPFATPIRITPEKYGRVARYYIGCSRDRVVTQEAQRLACAGLPLDRVYQIDADHVPFFSAPEELTNCLDAIAKKS